MAKKIKQFRTENYGFFIDLEDAPASVSVHPETGDILLNEGMGEDRYHGARVAGKDIRRLELQPVSKTEWNLVLYFGKDRTHILGTTSNHEEASKWCSHIFGSSKEKSITAPQN